MLAVVIILIIMNDLEKLEKTFNEIGLQYGKEDFDIIQYVDYDGEANYNTLIEINNGIGYYDFNCKFYFLDGKFQKHGCWE
jgi:hypothetical protein